jgi:hypothetical protein
VTGLSGFWWKCRAYGHQRGNRVTHDRQPEKTEHSLRQAGQLERQRLHLAPRHQPGQGAVSQDGHGKGLVLAVSPAQARHAALGLNIVFRVGEHSRVAIRRAGQVKRRPDEHRRGDVRAALVGIAPTAVLVLTSGQPLHSPGDQGPKRAGFGVVAARVPHDHRQGTGRRGRGERRAGQLPDPVSRRIPFGQQIVPCRVVGAVKSVRVDHVG